MQFSSQGQPFGAVQGSGIAFVTDAVMAPVTAAYQAQEWPAYRRQLPLVVGRLGAELMTAVQALNAYAKQKPAFMEFTYDHADGRTPQQFMAQQMKHELGATRAPLDIGLLAMQTARVVSGIAAFDQQHFGPARGTALRLEHGIVSEQTGIHATHQSSTLHRDAQGVPMAGGWREYLLRTTQPAYFAPNALTERVTGPITNTATLSNLGAGLWRPLDGEIVLLAAGPQGTFHGSHRPTAAEGRTPSFLVRMMQMP